MKRMVVSMAVLAAVQLAFAEAPLKVGVYGDMGPDGIGALELMRIVDWSPEMDLEVLTGEDVRADALQDVDLFVLPGGSGSAYDSLGEVGRAKLRDYIWGGGKCLATGTGATLLGSSTNETDRCLGLIPYETRGFLPYRLQLTVTVNAKGAEALGVEQGYDATLCYSGGPFFRARSGGVEGTSFTTWATYRSAINLNGHVPAAMFGSAAVVGGTCGAGKVIAFAHEPQYNYRRYPFLTGAIRWLTGRSVAIPFHGRRRGARTVGLALDGVKLAELAPLARTLDADSRFELVGVDYIGATFEALEGLDALVLPDGSDCAGFVAGGEGRGLLEETARSGVSVYAWGLGANLLPLEGAETCADAADALAKLTAALDVEPSVPAKAAPSASPLRVLVYGDSGPSGAGANEWYRLINGSPEMTVTVVSSSTLRNTDVLDNTDLVVMPGGSSSGIQNSLTTSGKTKLKNWIKNGGLYYGTCAGCALLLNEQYRIQIAPYVRLTSVETAWGGRYGVELNELGAAALGMKSGCYYLRYAAGPLLAPSDPIEGATFETWGTYCSEGSYEFDMNDSRRKQYGSGAIIAGTYYDGRVFATSSHPEPFRSTQELITKGFKWLSGRDVTFPKRLRKPNGVRIAVMTSFSGIPLCRVSGFVMAADDDPAFVVYQGDGLTMLDGLVQRVDAVVIPDMEDGLPSWLDETTAGGAMMRDFVAAGGRVFGWGRSAECAAGFGAAGCGRETDNELYGALREAYGVTTPPSVHVHDWTYETNSVLSCTTDGVVVKTCRAEGCPVGSQTIATPALGHDLTDWTVVTPPTETTRGLKRRTCRRPGCGYAEEGVVPKVGETWYKVGADAYDTSSFVQSYSSSVGWAETAGGKVDKDHVVDPEVNYVVPEGARLRTPMSGSTCTFAGKTLTLGGSFMLNSSAMSSKKVNLPPVTVCSTSATLSIGSPSPTWTVGGSIDIPAGTKLALNLYAESSTTGKCYGETLAAALSGAGVLSIEGSASYSPKYSYVTITNAAAFTGILGANATAKDMRFSLKVTGGFGGSVLALPVGTTNVVFNYDGLDAARGLPVATNEVPSALTNRLTLYSATADFSRDGFVLMTFPAGTELDPAAFTVNHAESDKGAKTAFGRLHARTAADGSVQLVANFCDHDWGAWTALAEPTFLAEGARERACALCGATRREPIARLTVPDGYCAATYVEGAASQYVYTGIKIQDRIAADLTFAFTQLKSAAYHMLGAVDRTEPVVYAYICTVNSSKQWRGSIGGGPLTSFADLPKAKVGETNRTVSVVNGTNFSFTVNGRSTNLTVETATASRNREFALFAYNDDGKTLSKCYAKLFEAKIYTNLTVLARHYLPVYQESSQAYGLWDAVNGTFKKPSGSSFLGELAPLPGPTVDGEPVEPGRVFETATSAKPIVYPSAVTLMGAPGAQTVVFGTTETAVPAHYTATLAADGCTVTLALNANAVPRIGGSDETEPFVVGEGKVKIHIANPIPTLWYALGWGETLGGAWNTNDYVRGAADFEDEPPTDAVRRFYNVLTTDVPEVR